MAKSSELMRQTPDAAPIEIGELQISDVTLQVDGDGLYDARVRGSVSSTLEADMESVRLDVVARSGDEIVGDERTYVDIVPGGGSVGFEVTFSYPIPANADVEVYWSL